jgi:adenylate cyclase
VIVQILIVDDNHDNIDLIRDILGTLDYDIRVAMDGASALELARKHHPDLMVLDVNMPGMSGFEVVEQLKKDEDIQSIPVIMLTALSDVENRVYAMTLGAEDYLTKPFSPRELIARVQRRLQSKLQTDDLKAKQEQIRNTFERFVAAPIVQQMLQHPADVKLGGKLQEITVLFADLEGFTSLSEQTEPEKLLSVLNQYHSLVVKIIQRYNGTIDKFIGDCVMALYNTPVEQADHISNAVKSALHIQDELHWFHTKLDKEYQLKINFGIHTGVAVVGNVGTTELMDYTAVGDTVNVAARLQGLADNGRILISDVVYVAAEDIVFGRLRGPFAIKGRQNAVTVYEISNTYIEP